MKRRILILFLSCVISAVGYAATHIIVFGGANGFSYNPSELTIQPGDEIIWQGNFSTHPLEAKIVPAGAEFFFNTSGSSFSYIATVPGTYTYRCDNHSEMTGSFTVENPAGLTKPLQVQKSIRIFPTRTDGDVNIDPGIFSRKNTSLHVDVYNALGQKLQTIQISGEEISNLRLHNLNKGIYLLAIKRNEELLQVTRIIKE
jgi:plastocyanin